MGMVCVAAFLRDKPVYNTDLLGVQIAEAVWKLSLFPQANLLTLADWTYCAKIL